MATRLQCVGASHARSLAGMLIALIMLSAAPAAAQDIYAFRRQDPQGYATYVQVYEPYLVQYHRQHVASGGYPIDFDTYATLWFNAYVTALQSRVPRNVEEQNQQFEANRLQHQQLMQMYEEQNRRVREQLRQ